MSWVGMPLPLQSEPVSREFIGCLWRGGRILTIDIRLAMSCNRFAFSISVNVNTNHGPVAHPRRWLQMNDASVSSSILEVHEPRFARSELDPSALVWSVDVSLPAIHHDAVLVRAINVFRSQNGLPARCHAARGGKDVVIAIAFIKLRSFDRGMVQAAIEYCLAIVEEFRAVRAHLINRENTLDAGAAVGPGMDQVGVAIIVPERSRIDPTPRASD